MSGVYPVKNYHECSMSKGYFENYLRATVSSRSYTGSCNVHSSESKARNERNREFSNYMNENKKMTNWTP